MENQIQTASEVKYSSRMRTLAHETRKNKQWLSMLVIVALAVSAVCTSCGNDDEKNGNENDIAVTGVSLDQTSITLNVGQTETLTATVEPADATDKEVMFTSDNPEVATVSSDNGFEAVVTAVAKGQATITVATKDGNYTATCVVTVNANENDKVKLVATMYDSYGMNTYLFEYDSQNRITKITILDSKSKYTLTYSGENLTKVNYEGVNILMRIDENQNIITWEEEFNDELVYVKNGNTITGPDFRENGNAIISLNNDGLMTKFVLEEYDYEYTFKYQGGNVTEMTSEGTGKDEITKITKYDNNKSPFYHCKTPKWFFWLFFRHWEFLCQNNPTEANGTFTSDGYKYDYQFNYEYDSDAYVTRRYREYDDYDDQEVFTFTYK